MARLLRIILALSATAAALVPSWQQQLDRVFLDIDMKPRTRSRTLFKVIERREEILTDVRSAVESIREKGFKDGHGEAIDLLFPKGTIIRGDLEGLQSLRKQLPEAIEDLRKTRPTTTASTPSPPKPEDLRKVAEKLRDGSLQSDIEEELKNALRRTPKGLETPKYTVDKTLGEDCEVRTYEAYAVAELTEERPDGDAFNILAAYLFGKNSEEKAMAMTMPVEMVDGAMAKRSAKNIIQPDATWKLQKRLKERKLGAEAERRRAVRNIYEGGAQREAERCAKRDAARKKRWEAAMVKNEEAVTLPSKEEIMRIAEERTRRDIAETRMKGAAKDLGFSADVDPAVLEREVKKSIHFEVGERVYANGEGAFVFEKVPELADKFKAIGTTDQRKREVCDVCHLKAMPLLKKCVGDHYDFFSREDIHRNGTLAEKAQDRKQLREAVEEVVREAAKAGLAELSRDEAALRLDIEKLQKKLVSLGAPPDQLVVVPSWCSWAWSRGSAAKAPLVVRRAALKGQLHGLKGDAIPEFDTPMPAIDFDLGPLPDTGPRGYELERARKGRLGIALDGAGETTTAERARREARKQAELAEWAEREGLGHLLSPEREAAPAPAPLVEDAPPPPFSPRIDADAWLAAGLAPLSM